MTATWRNHARVPVALGLVAAVLLGVGPARLSEPAPPPAGEQRPTGTVVVHGRAGSFGSLEQTLPSGQQLRHRPVPGWEPPEVPTGATAVAADGTVFVAGREPGGSDTGAGLAIGAYRPAAAAFTTIRLATTGTDQAGGPAAPAVTDLAPVAGGEAVAATAGSPEPGYEATGDWPSLSILTTVDGEWEVANQWIAADLDLSEPSLGELVSLPGSGQLVAIQPGGRLLALRLAGPDRDGRFTAEVTGRYRYPEVRDPVTGEHLEIGLRHLRADPTGEPGDERFAVIVQDLGDEAGVRPSPVQEFRYDAERGTIAPVSAPTIPGDQYDDDGPYYGYSAALYDHAGNLWAARSHGLIGGRLALYAAAADGGPLGGPDCRFDPAAPLGSHLTGGGDGPPVWGQACRPDFDLLQAQDLPAIVHMVQDPAGPGVVALALGGPLLPVRATGDAAGMSFEVGNLVDPGLPLLPAETSGLLEDVGFAPEGHLWTSVAARADGHQWLYEVDVADLFDPPPVRLPEVPGQIATVQAGYTTTTETERLDGSWATVDINSEAYLRPCGGLLANVGCSYDGVPGDGFILSERHGFGHLGGEVGYRVDVPAAGDYRVAYRVFTFEAVTDAELTLSAGGRTYRVPVDTDGQWRTVSEPDLVELPAGVHTLQLSAADGRGGWHLGWFSLQRA